MALEPPTPDVLARIYSAIGATPDGIERDVKYLKEWVSQQPHLPDQIDERILRNALILRKNSIERVKLTIDLMYTAKRRVPEFFDNRDPLDPELQVTINNTFCFGVPKLTDEGSRVIIMKAFDMNPDVFDFTKTAKVIYMSEIITALEDTCLDSIIVIDVQGAKLSLAATITIPLAHKFMYIGQKVFPARQRAVHIIHAPPFFDKIFALFKPFLKKKLAERVYIHSGGLGNMFDYIPKSIFPQDYGGDEPPLKELHAAWKKKLVEYRDWYLEDNKLMVDERKRPGKSRLEDDLFGFEGSFRQLNVD